MNKPAPKEPSMDEILSSIRQIIADDDSMSRSIPPSDFDGRMRQRFGRHVVGRCVDQIARERGRRFQSFHLGPVDAIRHLQLHRTLWPATSIALETILAVCPADRELSRDARRQCFGEMILTIG